MAEAANHDGTLCAEGSDTPKPGATSQALRELWEAAENAVEVVMKKNQAHDLEKVAEFAALRVSEIAKAAAHTKSKKMVEQTRTKERGGPLMTKKEDLTTLPNDNKEENTLIPTPQCKSQDKNESTKEKTEVKTLARPSITQPWKKIKKLGKGAFGVVYLGRDEKGMQFAAKEVLKEGEVEESLQKEIDILVRLSHKNIVQYFGHQSTVENMYMFMELMNGSIKDKMDAEDSAISPIAARKYTKEILCGLIYLHRNDYIHRDIKCANVLLDDSDTAKLADMGVSKVHANLTMTVQEQRAGSILWMSPEVLEAKGGGKRSDVWSIGCTVYEMLKKDPPFSELSGLIAIYQLCMKIRDNEHRILVLSQEEMDHKLREFLLTIFVEKSKRPYAHELAKHGWLR